jgi:hypothetical protein
MERMIRDVRKELHDWVGTNNVRSTICHKSIARLKGLRGGYSDAGLEWKKQAHVLLELRGTEVNYNETMK